MGKKPSAIVSRSDREARLLPNLQVDMDLADANTVTSKNSACPPHGNVLDGGPVACLPVGGGWEVKELQGTEGERHFFERPWEERCRPLAAGAVGADALSLCVGFVLVPDNPPRCVERTPKRGLAEVRGVPAAQGQPGHIPERHVEGVIEGPSGRLRGGCC